MKNILLYATLVIACYADAASNSLHDDFLHKAIWAGNPNYQDFSYGLDTLKLDPQKTKKNGDTLWHSLLYPSLSNHSQDILESRAKILNRNNVNPYQKNKNGKSAIDVITHEIATLSCSLTKASSKMLNNENSNNHIQKTVKKIVGLSQLLTIIVTTYSLKNSNKLPTKISFNSDKPKKIITKSHVTLDIVENIAQPNKKPIVITVPQKINKTAIEHSIKSIIFFEDCNREIRFGSWYSLTNTLGNCKERRLNSKTQLMENRSFSIKNIKDFVINKDQEYIIDILLK